MISMGKVRQWWRGVISLAGYGWRAWLGPWLFVATGVVDVLLLSLRFALLHGDAQLVTRFLACDMWVLMVLGCGVGAWDAARIMRMPSLVVTVRRRYQTFLLAWLLSLVPVAVERFVVWGVALACSHSLWYRHAWWTLWMAMGVQVLGIGWGLAAGSCLGRLCSARFAPVVAVVVMMVGASLLTDAGLGSPLFSPLGDTGASVSQVGLSLNPVPLGWQAALLLGTSCVFLAAHVERLRAWTVWTVPSLLLVVGCCMLLVASRFLLHVPALLPHTQAPDVCIKASTTICVYREHEDVAHETITDIDAQLDRLREQGYGFAVPDRIEEASARYDSSQGLPGRVSLGRLDGDPSTLSTVEDDLFFTLATPTWCASWTSEEGPSDLEIDDVRRVAMQLRFVASGMTAERFRQEADDTFEPMSRADTETLMEALRGCAVR